MAHTDLSDFDLAEAIIATIGQSHWEGVTLAWAYLSLLANENQQDTVRYLYERSNRTLAASSDIARRMPAEGFRPFLKPRKKTGSAENPITKLFPAAITEERFLELMEELCAQRSGLEYIDDREGGYTLSDFTLTEEDRELPINIKNAGTRFEKAQKLVGIDPDDCIPIPAYKAHGALEKKPELLYVISVDYGLVKRLDPLLGKVLSDKEKAVWSTLHEYTGYHFRDGEDAFVLSMVRKHWEALRKISDKNPFHVISARKAIRILQIHPKRTPGIGLRAWGTGASAEVNVHISLSDECTPWETVSKRIAASGITDVIAAVNRKKVEEVYDPEI